jgi:nitroimidazol reductase NimA-like FMN-containing flavoprotein (pyridoxamine 5'-phosphate oxidase superfamily)
MQGRMKQHPLSKEEIATLLLTQSVGNLGTLSPDGFPYVTPVHFVWIEDKIFIHGLCAGQKINYLKANPKVGFEVFKLNGLIHDPELPCDTNTDYQSVILHGTAKIIDDDALKIKVLDEVVKKYTPQHVGKSFPSAMLKATGIIEITPVETTGKFFK